MSGKTVLLVEDDAEIRDLLQDFLEEEGFDVVPAGNGKQALDYLSSADASRPDVVVLDLMMPLVTGWQVMERMKSDPALAEVPIVVLTAATRDKPPGATAFFRKPFNLSALFDAVKECAHVPATPAARVQHLS